MKLNLIVAFVMTVVAVLLFRFLMGRWVDLGWMFIWFSSTFTGSQIGTVISNRIKGKS